MTAPGVYLSGYPEMMRFFLGVPKSIKKTLVRDALFKAGKVHSNAASRMVTSVGAVDTGTLRDSMRVRRLPTKFKEKRAVTVGARWKDMYVPVSVSKGKVPKAFPISGKGAQAKADRLRMKRGATIRKMNAGRYAHLVEFGHGGRRPVAPKAHMRPAFMASHVRGVKVFNEKFRSGYKAEVRKYRWRARKKAWGL